MSSLNLKAQNYYYNSGELFYLLEEMIAAKIY